MSVTVSPASRRASASRCWCGVSFGLRPSFTPGLLLAPNLLQFSRELTHARTRQVLQEQSASTGRAASSCRPRHPQVIEIPLLAPRSWSGHSTDHEWSGLASRQSCARFHLNLWTGRYGGHALGPMVFAENSRLQHGSGFTGRINDLLTINLRHSSEHHPGKAINMSANFATWTSERIELLKRYQHAGQTPCTAHRFDQPSPNFGRSAERPSLTGAIFAHSCDPETSGSSPSRGGMTHFSIPLLHRGNAFFPLPLAIRFSR